MDGRQVTVRILKTISFQHALLKHVGVTIGSRFTEMERIRDQSRALRDDFFDHLGRLYACQLEIESLMFVGEAIMLNAAEVHERGL